MREASTTVASRVRVRDGWRLGCASTVTGAMILADHDPLLSPDVADRGRIPRHRRALHAGGGPDPGRAAGHRCRLWLHARDRAAHAGRHARACRGAAYECAGFCRAEMVRRGLSALHGLAGVARHGRAFDRHAAGSQSALQPPRHRDGDPDQHPQPETVDLLPRLPAAVRGGGRDAPAWPGCWN